MIDVTASTNHARPLRHLKAQPLPLADDCRPPRPNVSSTPAAPTAMALAFSALNALKTKK